MLPCGEVHWKILPAICRQLAVSLEKESVPRRRIAVALGASGAAVSQYISGKRGGGRLDRKSVQACRKLASRIAAEDVSGDAIQAGIARILVIAKKSKLGKRDPCAICMGAGHA